MKLIDLLVQELPKRGGWPDGAVECCWFRNDKQVYFYDENGESPEDFTNDGNYNFNLDHVTYKPTAEGIQEIPKSEYEAALAASKQPEWDGEGLPPVGGECEALYDSCDKAWFRAKIIAHDDKRIIGRWLEGSKADQLLDYQAIDNFRPIRTDADRKREEVIKEMASHVTNFNKTDVVDALKEIYDAVLAGKIKGLKVE